MLLLSAVRISFSCPKNKCDGSLITAHAINVLLQPLGNTDIFILKNVSQLGIECRVQFSIKNISFDLPAFTAFLFNSLINVGQFICILEFECVFSSIRGDWFNRYG